MEQQTACGSSFFVNLTDDLLDVIGSSFSPRDLCNLSICCKRVSVPTTFDKVWRTRCEELGILSSIDLIKWRKAVSSYKALCRFLTIVKPLLGTWIQENPRRRRVVYVMPGFASIVGCRVVPQEDRPILWSPVFEVISDDDGAPAFILHGRENDQDYTYPGTLSSVDKTCNALFLEIESKERNKAKEMDSKGSFSQLSLPDKQELLEIVTGGVGIPTPDAIDVSPFPCDDDKSRKDLARLSERRAMFIEIHKLGSRYIELNASHELSFDRPRQMDERTRYGYPRGNKKEAKILDVVSSEDTIGLTLKASTIELSFDEEEPPCMDESLLALYKYPISVPCVGQEYAGLWGGTFGWPLGNQTENMHGNTVFVVSICYSKENTLLRATKLSDGVDYIRYPQGYTMFTVNIDEPTTKSFPWWFAGVKHAYTGKGIGVGDGYKSWELVPGSFFVLKNDILAFLWKKSGSVLLLQRLNLAELLKKGERVSTLPPLANFSYLQRLFFKTENEYLRDQWSGMN